MLDNVLLDPVEMGVMVETSVYKHLAAFYYRDRTNVGHYRKIGSNEKEIDMVVEFPTGKIITEVKYRENAEIKETDAIVEIARNEKEKIAAALVITKRSEDYGVMLINTKVPIMRVPARAFLYLLGHAEKVYPRLYISLKILRRSFHLGIFLFGKREIYGTINVWC